VFSVEIIAILNQKGGSAKTTTAVNLGSALAEQKKRVLLIDIDPQGSASSWLGFREPSKGLYTVFVENGSIADIINNTAIHGLDIIASSPWLISADKVLSSEVGAETILKQRIDSLKEPPWDYILIDCPPTLGIMSLNALTAAHKVLVPLETHIMAVQGLVQLINTIHTVKERLNPLLEIDGILPCRVNKRTRLSQDIISDLRNKFNGKVYNTTIRENIKLAEAPSFGQPITVYDTKSTGAEDYRCLASEIIKNKKGKQRG
jgi:chromosome partitioning protein